jgi:hypothetical protein
VSRRDQIKMSDEEAADRRASWDHHKHAGVY